jgi:hypothetical protein
MLPIDAILSAPAALVAFDAQHRQLANDIAGNDRALMGHVIPIPDLLESNGVLALDSSDTGLGTGFLI